MHGASGKGGSSIYEYTGSDNKNAVSTGGGGGGSGYGSSIVKLDKGDTVTIVCGAVGSTTTVIVVSSVDSAYSHEISITSGKNGGDAQLSRTSSGGVGGISSGALDENLQGTRGSSGKVNNSATTGTTVAGGAGGAPAHTDGNKGGNGASTASTGASTKAGGAGKSGFVKIYRGNTNIVA